MTDGAQTSNEARKAGGVWVSGSAKATPRGAVLGLLFLIYVCNNMDRHIIAILAEPIRADLKLSDTDLGLLTGLVFALFYTIFGIPIGWLADRLGRIRVIFVSCVIWSCCSALGGLAGSFSQLALARIGVGVGEAGGSAPSYSLISALFRPHERGNALGLFHLGSPVATLTGAFACTWIATHWGWRAAVVGVSAPGVLVALVLLLAVREPVQAEPTDATASPPLWRSIVNFTRAPLLCAIALTAGLSSFTTYALAAWLPAFLMRVKHMRLEEVGVWYALGNALAFAIGLWGGGWLADRFARRSERAYALVPCAGLLAAALLAPLAIAVPGWQASPLLWMGPVAAIGAFLAPGATLVQNLAPAGERALFGALFLFVNNLIGSGLGPLYVGVISDRLRPSHGTASLSVGLAACIPMLLIAAMAQYLVSRQLPRKGAP